MYRRAWFNCPRAGGEQKERTLFLILECKSLSLDQLPFDLSMHTYWVYILASNRNGTLYVGVTDHLARRIAEHRDKLTPGFTSKYGVTRLVYVEEFTDAAAALAQEKRIKKWQRSWKLRLIERDNPDWRDLYEEKAK